MFKHPVLVRNITHLTDARYFAAMGVEWISMELTHDPASFMRWHTIRDWVAGVKLAAEVSMPDEMLIAKTMIDARPDGIILHKPGFMDELSSVQLFFDIAHSGNTPWPEGSNRIIQLGTVTTGQLLSMDPKTTFLEAEWTRHQLDQLLQSGYTGGICFTGGEEDVTGVRDYELMDEMLERIMD
jgi:hypothetical protein